MSDEGDDVDVTFVGGHAAEQHDAGEQPTGDHAAELEAAKAAVKEAIKKAAGDGVKAGKRAKAEEAQETGEEPSEADQEPAKAKEDEETEAEKAKLSRIRTPPEKLAPAKAEQNQELARQQAQFQQQLRQFRQEQYQLEQQKQQLARLRSDPASAIKAAGWDPEEFILSLAKEGTEEGKMARVMREQQEQLKEMHRWREEQQQQREMYARQMQHQQAVQQRQSVEKEFLGHALNEESRPHTAAMYAGNEGALVAYGDIIAAQYREVTGQEASLQDIAEYIEEQLAERANKLYEKRAGGKAPQQAQRQAAAPQNGKPSKAPGRTLTGSGSSERRSLARNLQDLDGEERILAAREAVRLALANSPKD